MATRFSACRCVGTSGLRFEVSWKTCAKITYSSLKHVREVSNVPRQNVMENCVLNYFLNQFLAATKMELPFGLLDDSEPFKFIKQAHVLQVSTWNLSCKYRKSQFQERLSEKSMQNHIQPAHNTVWSLPPNHPSQIQLFIRSVSRQFPLL